MAAGRGRGGTAAIYASTRPDRAIRHGGRTAYDVRLDDLKAALATFEIDNGRFPTTAEGLDALVKKPEGIGDTWEKLLDGVPKDPWGHPYIYKEGGPNGYELRSGGPDGKAGSASN